MTASLAHIWRHVIKGIGSESVPYADLSPDAGLVGDRQWALLNAAAPDLDHWQPRRNFLQVASGPKLASVSAYGAAGAITLIHPQRDPITLNPEHDGDRLAAWLGDLWPAERAAPARLVKAPPQGMTDVPFASISIGNLASLRALGQRIGTSLDMRRFRINLWLDDLAPWEEIDLLNHDLQLGTATLSPVEPIERCRAPDADPRTGNRDINMLAELERGWNTRDFGVYFKVSCPGTVSVGDRLVRL